MPDAGREEDATEHQRAEAAEERERAEVGQCDGPMADHGWFDNGVGVAERARHQPGARRRANTKAPMMRALVQPQSEPSTMPATRLATERAGGPRRAGRSGGRPGRAPLGAADTEEEGEQAEGQVDEEDPAPTHLDEQAADGRAERAAAPPTADHSPMAAPFRAGPNAGRSRPREVGSMRAPPLAYGRGRRRGSRGTAPRRTGPTRR